MKTRIYFLAPVIAFMCVACIQKNYTCACTDAMGNTNDVFTIKDTKRKADSKCKSYGGQKDSLLVSEGSCRLR